MNGAEAGLALATGDQETAQEDGLARRVPATHAELDQHPQWAVLARLPMRLTVGVPLPRFRVRDLLALDAGQLIPSAWSATTDVPAMVGSAQLSWAEFEVVEKRMAIRLTRLA